MLENVSNLYSSKGKVVPVRLCDVCVYVVKGFDVIYFSVIRELILIRFFTRLLRSSRKYFPT